MNKTFETTGEVSVEARVSAGRIDIESGEEGRAVVEVTPGRDDEGSRSAARDTRVEIRREAGGTVIEIETPRSWLTHTLGRDPQVHVRARVPDDASLRCSASSAHVTGRGRFGSVDIKTASGHISVENCRHATIKSASGDVHLEHVAKDSKVQTASGDVVVKRVDGSAKVQSASGDVKIHEGRSDVKVQTASGDQSIGAISRGTARLQSASGDVEVGVARGSSVWMDANSLSGETTSDLDVTNAPDDGAAPRLELHATAMSGDIHITRAAASQPIER